MFRIIINTTISPKIVEIYTISCAHYKRENNCHKKQKSQFQMYPLDFFFYSIFYSHLNSFICKIFVYRMLLFTKYYYDIITIFFFTNNNNVYKIIFLYIIFFIKYLRSDFFI